jgi:hypothetical protein
LHFPPFDVSKCLRILPYYHTASGEKNQIQVLCEISYQLSHEYGGQGHPLRLFEQGAIDDSRSTIAYADLTEKRSSENSSPISSSAAKATVRSQAVMWLPYGLQGAR